MLFVLPATRPALAAHPGIAAAVLTMALVVALIPVKLLLRRLRGRSEASLRSSRRTVVGVRSRIQLPRVVMITDLNPVAAQVIRAHPATGLQRIPHPDGTRMALWVPFGLERVVHGALRPVLPTIDRGVGASKIVVVCSGRWVLISAEFDADDATLALRLEAAVGIAAALEHGAPGR